MCKLPEHFLEDLEEDYQYDCDESFLEQKICELDDLITIFEDAYFRSELNIAFLLDVIVHKSKKLRKFYQFFLENYISQNNSCKNT